MGDEKGPRSLSLLVLGPDEGELFISVGLDENAVV